MRDYDRKVMELIHVDDFDPAELAAGSQAPKRRSRHGGRSPERARPYRDPGQTVLLPPWSGCLENTGVIYEVNLEADAAIEAAFDTWLRDHIADMLQLPGFRAAEVLGDASAPPGKVRRTVQYRLTDQAALDTVSRRSTRRGMRTRGAELFGERYTAERRVLAHREDFITGAVSTENCLNCGEVLTGQHCSHCGQRARGPGDLALGARQGLSRRRLRLGLAHLAHAATARVPPRAGHAGVSCAVVARITRRRSGCT